MAAALTVIAVGAALTGVGPAAAGTSGTSCGYAESGPPGARGNYIQVQQQATGRKLTIRRAGRRILFKVGGDSPVRCTGPQPTVHNIDRIFLLSDGTRRLLLDMGGGPLGPGASESGAGAEIEIFMRVSGGSGRRTAAQLSVYAGDGPNVVALGRAGGSEQVNLNARRERLDDTDVYIESVEYGRSYFLASLAGGDNTVDGRGPGRLRPSRLSGTFYAEDGANRIFSPLGGGYARTGTGADHLVGWANRDSFGAGGGRDRLEGGRGADRLNTGGGRDKVDAGPGDDHVNSSDTGVDAVDCGPGNDTIFASAGDVLGSCETVSRR